MKHGNERGKVGSASSGSSLKEGLSKKESFTPEKANPPFAKTPQRTKHDNPRIKRKVGKM